MAEVMLYVALYWWGDLRILRHPMPDLATCRTAVEAVRFQANDGDENETAIAAWCAPKGFERHYGSTWHNDEVLD